MHQLFNHIIGKSLRGLWAVCGSMLLTLTTLSQAAAPTQPTSVAAKAVATRPEATPTTPSTNPGMMWNFHQADINDIIQLMAKTTGQHYIVPPDVHGTITIMAHQPMNAAASQQVFLSALRTLGYTTQTQGHVTRIIPMHTAHHTLGNTGPVHTTTNQWMVQVVPVVHVAASQMAPILRPLLPDDAHVYAYGPSNSLIVSGPSDEIERLIQIIHRVDQDSNRRIDMITLHHTDASRVATVINQLQSADRNLGKMIPVSIVADHHSNAILLSGPKDEKLRYHVLISQLDAPTAQQSSGNTEVMQLNYLKAKELAPMLTKIAEKQAGASLNSSNGDATTTQNTVSIQAENNTNAIVITAPPSIMHALKNVVHQLDVRPIQVAVEAIIAQVDEGTSSRLGITWGTNEQRNTDTTSNNGAPTAALGFQEGIGVIHKGNLQAVINALKGNSTTDVLSTPSIVVMDNQKATLSVGKDVAVDNRTYALNNNTADSYTPFTNVEYKKVALSLTVTPQISPDGGVRLTLNQTNDTLQDPSDPGTRPIINTSQIDTTVLVHNGDILVLGGLISNDVEESTSKVPLLGDLPLIRAAFRYKKTSVVKKNLMIFLKPVLLLDHDTRVRLTQNKYDWIIQKEWQHQRGKQLIQEGQKPILPPFKTQSAQPIQLPEPFSHHE